MVQARSFFSFPSLEFKSYKTIFKRTHYNNYTLREVERVLINLSTDTYYVSSKNSECEERVHCL